MTDTIPDDAHCDTREMGDIFSMYSVELETGRPTNDTSVAPAQYAEKSVRTLVTSSVAVGPHNWDMRLVIPATAAVDSGPHAQEARSVREVRQESLVRAWIGITKAEEAQGAREETAFNSEGYLVWISRLTCSMLGGGVGSGRRVRWATIWGLAKTAHHKTQ